MGALKVRFPNVPERLSGLGDLAYNLWWSRRPAARMLFKMLSRSEWKDSVHNPVKMLRELPAEILESAANDQEYLHHCNVALARFRKEEDVPIDSITNGVPHLSILDGWWIEGSNGKNGWAFSEEGDDGRDASAICDILEQKVIPLYYKVEDDGIPHGWVSVMKEAIKNTAPFFSASRMVKEYVSKFYRSAMQSAYD